VSKQSMSEIDKLKTTMREIEDEFEEMQSRMKIIEEKMKTMKNSLKAVEEELNVREIRLTWDDSQGKAKAP
jgi:septal ring factor EnvC (AmiA/AmiB activator)